MGKIHLGTHFNEVLFYIYGFWDSFIKRSINIITNLDNNFGSDTYTYNHSSYDYWLKNDVLEKYIN